MYRIEAEDNRWETLRLSLLLDDYEACTPFGGSPPRVAATSGRATSVRGVEDGSNAKVFEPLTNDGAIDLCDRESGDRV